MFFVNFLSPLSNSFSEVMFSPAPFKSLDSKTSAYSLCLTAFHCRAPASFLASSSRRGSYFHVCVPRTSSFLSEVSSSVLLARHRTQCRSLVHIHLFLIVFSLRDYSPLLLAQIVLSFLCLSVEFPFPKN